MSWLIKRSALVVLPLLGMVLTGCPKVIPGHIIRIDQIDMLCREATLSLVAFQGNEAIGNFEAKVQASERAEFVIPQGVAQRIDFSKPVRLFIALRQGGSIECFLAKRNLIFEGKLIRTGTDPRSGNPVYTLNFWEDFKIEYR